MTVAIKRFRTIKTVVAVLLATDSTKFCFVEISDEEAQNITTVGEAVNYLHEHSA